MSSWSVHEPVRPQHISMCEEIFDAADVCFLLPPFFFENHVNNISSSIGFCQHRPELKNVLFKLCHTDTQRLQVEPDANNNSLLEE